MEMNLVERDHELSHLDAALSLMLESSGQAVFISGEAGTGKTALASAFVEDAVERVDDLVIAVGTCDPQTGMVDAYLPFREILQVLTGTLESEREAKGGWIENRRRLGSMANVAGEVLLELGPDLVGLFVPGGSLLAKVGTNVATKAGLVSALSQRISGEDDSDISSSGVDQNLIFEQYVNVIRGIAEQRALILVVDDLHWADTASIQLLFRLGRRLDGVKLLVIGTFRPNDVAAGRADARHPLEPVVGELKRYLGDIVLGLDQTDPDDQRQFVDALLNSEPNTFGEEFREVFWERTSGHPLFSVELVAALKQSGGIALNSDLQWTVTDDLDWRAVPGRVEGLIDERVRRLPAKLRNLLREAAVEGDKFTIEVLATIENMPIRELIPLLSEELQRTHRLIEAESVDWVGDRSLSLYRFSNKQIHQQIYDGLDPVELSYGHRDVAGALERLYGDRVSDVAAQLAYHYGTAGNRDKAVSYLTTAAESAASAYANDEALTFLSRALELTDYGNHQVRSKLLSMRERVYWRVGEYDAQRADLDALGRIADETSDNELRLEVALRNAQLLVHLGDFDTSSISSRSALEIAKRMDDKESAGRAYLYLARGLSRRASNEEAEVEARSGLKIAEELGLHQLQVELLQVLSGIAFNRKDHETCKRILENALDIAERLGWIRRQGELHYNLGITTIALGKFDYCENQFEQALLLAEKVGDQDAIARAHAGFGEVYRHAGKPELALKHSRLALESFENMGSTYWATAQTRAVADALTAMGRPLDAIQPAEEAVAGFREIGAEPFVMDCIATLAAAKIAAGDIRGASKTADEAVEFLLMGGDVKGAAYPLRIYAVCLEVLNAVEDPRYEAVLKLASETLYDLYPGGGKMAWHQDIQERAKVLASTSPSS